ncbi:DNA-3-methyladenine glycosylase [Georgenia satyanarayanai]|uniref:DNA-3-methyladenine glycosylase n=1 Tax=Georgenia satyanarayanai TaxID=860221 RepID=UPI00203F8D2E|nr:DNA-3-methyladenine glycosylase [Georgenia satyanarayanai]MCM3662607.1 DNA-3-methyladenine glycosylase [Georgenia satyanarayanai]
MLDLTQGSLDVAPLLLGAHLTVRDDAGAVTVRLTEVEAYDGANDPGSHAYRGLTPRTEVMFGPPGRLYVYFTYGMHWCANVVCGEDGRASAVLLRAGEVVDGVELARSRRPAAKKDVDLARGPARMAQALGLARPDNGVVLSPGGRAELLAPAAAAEEIATGPRVGVSGPGGDGETYPWRFWLPGDPTVSTYRPGVRRRRRPTDGGRAGTTDGAH